MTKTEAAGPAVPEDAPALEQPTETPEPAADAPPEPQGPQWGSWRYTGPAGRIYTAVPVTPEPGDVVGWWGPPGHDGCWEPTEDAPTRMPDNWRPDLTEAEAAKLRGDTTNPLGARG